jgi:hypothetical protein
MVLIMMAKGYKWAFAKTVPVNINLNLRRGAMGEIVRNIGLVQIPTGRVDLSRARVPQQ